MQPQHTAVAGIRAAPAVNDVQANSTPAEEVVPGMQSAKCSTCSISRGRHPVHPPGRRPCPPCPPRDPVSCPCHARGHPPLAASLQIQHTHDIKMLAHQHRSLSLSSHASAGCLLVLTVTLELLVLHFVDDLHGQTDSIAQRPIDFHAPNSLLLTTC